MLRIQFAAKLESTIVYLMRCVTYALLW